MLNGGAREGVLGVGRQHRLAGVDLGQVVDCQGRVAVEGVAAGADVGGPPLGAAGGLDGDGGAVHVVLLSTGELAGPGPGVRVVSSGDIRRDLDIVSARAGAILGGAAALDAEDDRPTRRLGGLHIGRQGNLARATTVDSRAGEAHANSLSSGGRVRQAISRVECGSISRDLAGVVAGCERRVVRVSVRLGVGEDHVCRTHATQRQRRCNDGGESSHLDVCVFCFVCVKWVSW